MFKKPIKVGAQNQLSGKDRKTIKSKMSQIYDEKSVETMFARNEKIICAKVTGSKMLIYSGDEYPLFVDGTGKNDYFPSVYTCQAYGPLTKYLTLNEGVENFIFNGANLMWPGVQNFAALGQFKKDEVIGIRSAKGEVIAIGAMGCSLGEFNDNNDKSGVAVYILHYKSDKLWDSGPKFPVEVIIPHAEESPKEEQAKKKQTKIQQPHESAKIAQKQEQPKQLQKKEEKNRKKSPSPKANQPSSDQGSDDNNADFMGLLHEKGASKKPVMAIQQKTKTVAFDDFDDDRGKKGKKKGPVKKKNNKQMDQEIDDPPRKQKQNPPVKKNKKEESESEEQQIVQKQPKNPKKGKKGGKGKEKQKEKKPESDDEEDSAQENDDKEKSQEGKQVSTISTKIMDNYLRESFLNVLKLSRVDDELPIDSGRFYMDYMLLARPEGVKLQIKQSSYKKLGKFYQEMAKQKFIEFKHGKEKKGQQGSTISKIFYDNEDLKNYVPSVKRLGEKEVQIKEQQGNLKAAKLKLSKTVTVKNVYAPNQVLYDVLFKKKVDFLQSIDDEESKDKQKKNEYFSEAQLRTQMNRYIDQISENKKKTEKQVILDYKKHQFISLLMQKEIQEFQQNMADAQIQKPAQDSEQEDDNKKGKKDKKKTNTFRIDRELLINKMMKKTSAYHHIGDKQNDLDSFKEGTFKGIQLFAEKANNKNVTKIIGLDLFITPRQEIDRQINSLAQMFQQKFACSVNVQNLPGKNAGKEIILHGTFLDQLEEFFVIEHGVKKEYITTVNKLDKKKKNH